MASSLSLCFALFLVLVIGHEVIALSRNDHMGMNEDELLGVFEVFDALLDDPIWAQVHPQPCTDTPWPGLQCEIAYDNIQEKEEEEDHPPIFHVTKIHIGPDILNPPCKSSAHLSISLQKLPYLKVLSIFNCFVHSPAILDPTLFFSLSSLEHLALVSNPSLCGKIPSSLGHITSLKVLSLSQNKLQGNIPNQLGGLVNIEQLDLSYNNLSGEIPKEIGGLKSLTILDLSWNNLEGQVPYSLGQLQALQKIDLGSNKLLGRMPPELGKLKRLVLLDLSHNFMNGPIPETFSGLEQLQYLIVDHNPINSRIPLIVGSLKRLASISLSGCGLTGPIPNSLSSLKNLTALSLDNNSLVGTIPSSLGSLPNLDQLNVSNNQLSGELLLPEEFIGRLGKRLDVRGNSGLCTSNKIYNRKNISIYLETKACLDKIGINGGSDHDPDEDQNPDEVKGIQPSLYHGKMSSYALPCLDQKLSSMYFFSFFFAFLFVTL